MSEAENTALARRWFDEVWNQRREATVHELLHPEALGHLEGMDSRGVQDFLNARSSLLGAFPDFRISVDDAIAQADNVAVRWSVKCTHDGELMGIAPTATSVEFRGMTWLRFAGGRIVEGWDSWNQGRLIAELQDAAAGR